MPAQILSACADEERWNEALRELPFPLRDVYALPEYIRLHCFEPGTEGLLFTYSKGAELWCYPFLLQPIPTIDGYPLPDASCDISAPYGYGGPLATTTDTRFLRCAHAAFAEWCHARGVVAEFARCHPLLETHRWLDPQTQLVFDRKTVSLNLLAFDPDHLPFDPDTRYMLRRAQRAGVSVQALSARDNISRFIELYRENMQRLEADAFYFFDDRYFAGLANLVEKAGWLLVAQRDGVWCAAAILLRGATFLHYHLSASDRRIRVPGVNNLVLLTAAQVGTQHGLHTLHLGGGRSRMPEDSLLRFKARMATDSHDFYVGRRIHDTAAYDALRAIWRRNYPSLASRYGDRVLFYRYRTTAR